MIIQSLSRTTPAVYALIILLVLNLGVMAWFGYHWHQRYQDRYLDRAEQALIEGNKAGAIRAFSAHMRDYPDDDSTAVRLEDLQQQYRRRYLDEAEAHLQTDDKVAAIKEYRSHIEDYPDDYEVRLKLARLYEELNINDASESMYRNIIEELSGSGNRVEAIARQRLLRHINKWANEIKIRADRLFEKGQFEAAAEEYTRVINLRSRNPALDAGDAVRSRAVAALNDVIAKRAFSLWRSGNEDALDDLTSDRDSEVFPDTTVPAEVMSQRTIMLSNYFWDYADRLFEREDWHHAAGMYKHAREMRNSAGTEGADPNTPTLLFNYAVSEHRAGNPRNALEAVKRLQRDYAYHEKAAVSRLKQELEDESGVNSEE